LAGSLLLLLQPHEKLDSRSWEAPHLWEDLKLGLQYIGQMPLVRAALLQMVVLYSLFAALAVLAVRMAEVMAELEADQFGVLLAAAGLGMGIGAFWVGHIGRGVSRRAWSGLGSLLLSLALVALSWTERKLFPSLAWIALLGCGGALVAVPMQTLLQEETPEHLRGQGVWVAQQCRQHCPQLAAGVDRGSGNLFGPFLDVSCPGSLKCVGRNVLLEFVE
jgi:predicted MFS family arabinose efflux permease